MSFKILALFFVPCLACLLLAETPALRTWTSTDGRTLQGRLLSLEGTAVVLELASGQSAKVPLDRLSAEDQAYIKQIGNSLAAIAVATKSERIWPDTVEVSARSIEVSAIEESLENKNYVYRSEFFQFTAQDKLAVSVMKEIARTFEATHTLVKALPWGIDPAPPADLGYYQAKFYATRRSYMLEGGPENSGGVYFSKDRIFRVPFESLGVEMRGKTWFKNSDYRNDTLVHEITHQMMHDFLPYLPTWVIEGTAEYTEMLPFNAGKFLASSHERGIKEYMKEFNERLGMTTADVGSIADHMNMTGQVWHEKADGGGREQARLYYASCLLVYYFSHLDGDGKGTRFLKYLDQIAAGRDAWKKFFSNPEVKLNADGSFTYPRSLPLPEQKRDEAYGIAQLSVLLDGRTPYQLEEDVKTGFKKIGVKW
jgi:hypothetical protein